MKNRKNKNNYGNNFKYILFNELKRELYKSNENIDCLKVLLLNKLLVIYCNDSFEFANLLSKLPKNLQIKNVLIREISTIRKEMSDKL